MNVLRCFGRKSVKSRRKARTELKSRGDGQFKAYEVMSIMKESDYLNDENYERKAIKATNTNTVRFSCSKGSRTLMSELNRKVPDSIKNKITDELKRSTTVSCDSGYSPSNSSEELQQEVQGQQVKVQETEEPNELRCGDQLVIHCKGLISDSLQDFKALTVDLDKHLHTIATRPTCRGLSQQEQLLMYKLKKLSIAMYEISDGWHVELQESIQFPPLTTSNDEKEFREGEIQHDNTLKDLCDKVENVTKAMEVLLAVGSPPMTLLSYQLKMLFLATHELLKQLNAKKKSATCCDDSSQGEGCFEKEEIKLMDRGHSLSLNTVDLSDIEKASLESQECSSTSDDGSLSTSSKGKMDDIGPEPVNLRRPHSPISSMANDLSKSASDGVLRSCDTRDRSKLSMYSQTKLALFIEAPPSVQSSVNVLHDSLISAGFSDDGKLDNFSPEPFYLSSLGSTSPIEWHSSGVGRSLQSHDVYHRKLDNISPEPFYPSSLGSTSPIEWHSSGVGRSLQSHDVYHSPVAEIIHLESPRRCDPSRNFKIESLQRSLRCDQSFPDIDVESIPSLTPHELDMIIKACGEETVIWPQEGNKVIVFTTSWQDQTVTDTLSLLASRPRGQQFTYTLAPPLKPARWLAATPLCLQMAFKGIVEGKEEFSQVPVASLLVNTDDNGHHGLYALSCAHVLQITPGLSEQQADERIAGSVDKIVKGQAELYLDDFNGNSSISKDGIVKAAMPILHHFSSRDNPSWFLDGLLVHIETDVSTQLLKTLASLSNFKDPTSERQLTVHGVYEANEWPDVEILMSRKVCVYIGVGKFLIPGRIVPGPSFRLPGFQVQFQTMIPMVFEQQLFPGQSGSPVFIVSGGNLELLGLVCTQQSCAGIKQRQSQHRYNYSEIIGVMPAWPFLKIVKEKSFKSFQKEFSTVAQWISKQRKKVDDCQRDQGYETNVNRTLS